MFSNLITSQYLFMFILTIGLIAVILEIFIPSFGILGIAGIYLILNAFFAIPNIDNVYSYIFFSVIIAAIASAILIKLMLSKFAAKKFVLDTKVTSEGTDEATKKIYLHLIGQEGEVLKPLRPSGLIKIDNNNYDVISYGEFLSIGSKVIVDKVEGNKIYCRRKD